MACTDPTPPCVGSLWEHKDGERRRVRMSIFDDELGDCVAGPTTHGGTFNVTGTPLRFDELLTGAARALGTRPSPRWMPENDLLAKGVQPWVDMPLWIAGQDQTAGISRALASGLALRDPVETAHATWTWDRTRDPGKPLVAGLSDEREAALLRAAGA